MSDVHRLVRRLREEPGLSRNRHFDELSKPEAQRARRLVRRLRGLERELSVASRVEVQPTHGGYVVRIEFAGMHARREAWLSHDEHDLLAESDVGRRLRLGFTF